MRGDALRFAVVAGGILAWFLVAGAAGTTAVAPPGGSPGCADRACHGPLLDARHAHAPAREGECGSCHRPVAGAAHPDSARTDFTLAARGAALCTECHEPFTGRTEHAPAAEGECLACHDPHGAARPKLMRRPVNETCFECHEAAGFRVHAVVGVDLGSGHPVGGPPDPSRKGESLSCASCHDPHATDTPRLWRFGAQGMFDLCGRCHEK